MLQLIKEKVTFMNGLRPEWKMAVSIVNAHEQFKNDRRAQVFGILESHEDETMESIKSTTDVGPLALVATKEVTKVKKSKEKVVVADSDSDATDEEFINEEKALIVCNPKKFPKNNFSKLRSGGDTRSHGARSGYKSGNSFSIKKKNESGKNY